MTSSTESLIAIHPLYAETQPSAGLLITGPPKGYQHCLYMNSQPGQADSTWMLCRHSYETGSAVMSEDLFYHSGFTGEESRNVLAAEGEAELAWYRETWISLPGSCWSTTCLLVQACWWSSRHNNWHPQNWPLTLKGFQIHSIWILCTVGNSTYLLV